jgi:hypothetical protein
MAVTFRSAFTFDNASRDRQQPKPRIRENRSVSGLVLRLLTDLRAALRDSRENAR